MNYFLNSKNTEWFPLIPSALLPLFYKEYLEYIKLQNRVYIWNDNKSDFISNEIPFILYISWWRLASFLIIDLIEDKLGYDKNEIKITNNLFDDLGADSLDIVEIFILLEKLLGISINSKLEFERVSDLIDYLFLVLIVNINEYKVGWPNYNKDFLLSW